MKIVGIDKNLTTGYRVGLILEPPLSDEVFEQIQKLPRTPIMECLNFENHRGRLVYHSVQPDAENTKNNVTSILNVAVEKAKELEQFRREQPEKQADVEKRQKNDAINSAAKAWGVPIK